MRIIVKKWGLIACSIALFMTLAACSASSAPTSGVSSSGGAAGTGGKAVGFIFVGAKDDYGYNQAAYIGSQGVEKAFPDLKVLRSENVPETAEAERVMEEMIRNGAKIIFPTSYGHLDPALNVAKRHPDVLFYHQGGLKTAANLGTYFGTIWEPVYLAGIAAGKMSKSGKLGYIVSVPIPQVLLNVNAFELGAKSVNPSATTTVVFTGSWCDPAQQANAANSMIDQGIDVLSQHQDCTKTVIETAERRGALSVGYHAEASALAPKGWVTGSIWNWSDLYVDMVRTGIAGTFKGSKYDGKYRGQLKDHVVQLASFGNQVPDDVKKLVEKGKADLIAGTLNPFNGPIKDQKGTVKIEAGAKLELDKLEATDYFVEGVIGSIPK
ncbi:BMP family ABC transporter substrate-binding protein [Paenibacillus chondroitinus]|uniref:BMP family ABC transporter substrate-binding protein n=1 Tax=Paenibacillus chondroitinus TaxID=59842 RepID=A0ABU6DND6_9BACL|nr:MULTISPECIES: BMP family ABC transporter substrate-binding protein [Paenibacillus]MCY9662085.1 BMP family ABC transporter substrate-binding protein [Paenibacillus anseongense]MEB4798302.1 BMP family ABC transporter substrate-binding protein [Paenibacillus chondroitinus]